MLTFNRLFPRSNATPSSTRPIFLEFRSSEIFILTVVCFAIFTDIFVYGFIAPVLPFGLESRLGVPHSDIQKWTSVLIALYGAALLVTSPFIGWIADRTNSRQAPMIVSLLALGASTVMLCVGNSLAVFAIGRVLTGVSSAAVWTIGCALLSDTVGIEHIGKAMGYVSLSMSLGILVSPLLGGIVYARGGWYSVFSMAFGLVAVDVVLRFIMIEKSAAAKYFDVPAEKTTIAEAAEKKTQPETDEVPTSPVQSDNKDAITVPLPDSSSTAQPLDDVEARAYSPQPVKRSRLPPVLTLLTSPRLLSALWVGVVTATLLSSFDATLTLRASRIFNFTSEGAGLLFLAIAIPHFIAPITGSIGDKYGNRWLAPMGLALSMPAFICLRFVYYNSPKQVVLLCALLAIIGFGMATSLPVALAEITHVVQVREQRHPGVFGARGAFAQGYALLNMAYACGLMIGPIWGGLIEEKAGWATMGWTLGLLAGVSVIPTFIYTGGPIYKR